MNIKDARIHTEGGEREGGQAIKSPTFHVCIIQNRRIKLIKQEMTNIDDKMLKCFNHYTEEFHSGFSSTIQLPFYGAMRFLKLAISTINL